MRLTDEEMVAAVEETLDSLPDWVREELGDVAVLVDEAHPDGLLGIYDPVGGLRRILIFRSTHPSREEVRRTVLHEIGHHFGMGEEQLAELGYG
jgi:predicted Zn-dependent protease with MMP-like domain